MVSREFPALAAKRAARARLLAERYPASREALLFYAEIADLQQRLFASLPATNETSADVPMDSLLPARRPLVDFVRAKAPERLREAAHQYDDRTCLESLHAFRNRGDTTSPNSFFARVLLQPAVFGLGAAGSSSATDTNSPQAECPHCRHRPQCGCLRPRGDGTALMLACSLCLREWAFPRPRCPGCGESDHHRINFYSTAEIAHIEVQVCESCHAYIHLIHAEKEIGAIADVDELAALPLDVWARGKGYRKVQQNLVGI